MAFLGDQILEFLRQLKLDVPLPRGIQVMNPYQDPATFPLCHQFYRKYYSDRNTRILIIGINPGRFGGGLTGIPFTDPIRLQTICEIQNDLPKKSELSSEFIYRMMNELGGEQEFYKRFYFTSVSPLGFTEKGKNLNYYDNPNLARRLKPFMIKCLQTQLAWGMNRDVAFCLGEGDNFKFLSTLNNEHRFFEKIIPLAHPRFIMQYRRKKLTEYIRHYQEKLNLPETDVS